MIREDKLKICNYPIRSYADWYICGRNQSLPKAFNSSIKGQHHLYLKTI